MMTKKDIFLATITAVILLVLTIGTTIWLGQSKPVETKETTSLSDEIDKINSDVDDLWNDVAVLKVETLKELVDSGEITEEQLENLTNEELMTLIWSL